MPTQSYAAFKLGETPPSPFFLTLEQTLGLDRLGVPWAGGVTRRSKVNPLSPQMSCKVV